MYGGDEALKVDLATLPAGSHSVRAKFCTSGPWGAQNGLIFLPSPSPC